MELTPGTRILDLIKNYDFLLDFLVEYSPEFKKLRNPVMRKIMGRFATVEMAASMAKVGLDKLMEDMAGEIRERTGDEAIVRTDAASAIDPERLELLKGIIRDLHSGVPMEDLKTRFTGLLLDVNPTEISQMEQQLIAEGLPQEEVKELCDVHVEVFRQSLDSRGRVETPPGHPVHTFQAENAFFRALAGELEVALAGMGESPAPPVPEELKETVSHLLDSISQIDIHYRRKENQLFPFLEKRGVSGPSRVMWAIHDDIRALLKEVSSSLDSDDPASLVNGGHNLVQTLVDMIYKEENILFPMSMEVLEPGDWGEIYRGEGEIGYVHVTPGTEWSPPNANLLASVEPRGTGMPRALPLDTGLLSLDQLNLMLKHLPVDISFVDENDDVRYYSDVPDRIFPRSPGVIGRSVQNCHPHKSLHMVDAILDAFRSGEKDTAEFWIGMGGRFIHIRYFAVRDVEGAYRGCLEVSQDVTDIRALEGERRLLEWEE